MKQQGIYWLASYPKSGNTWFRIFLQNLQEDLSEPVQINDLSTGSIASARAWLDETLGFDTADLYPEHINRLRPAVYAWEADQLKQADQPYGYHKIHDACWQLDNGDWLISEQATVGALYIIRNPLDVVISYANHSQCSIDQMVQYINDPENCISDSKSRTLRKQSAQRLLSWSHHVASWVDNPVIQVEVIRYEDMHHQALPTFTRAAAFLQLSTEPEKIAKAMRHAAFNKLQVQEQQTPFSECPTKAKQFFRKGVAGDWQSTLTEQQIADIIAQHAPMMHRFGYVDAAGNPQVM